MNEGPLLAVHELSKSYGATQAVAAVGFEIYKGEVFGLLGPNGAGKTTIVESVAGLVAPDSGSIAICGMDLRRQPREAKRRIGVTLQLTGLQDRITPRETLSVFGSLYRTLVKPELLLERFDLADKSDAAYETLSGGQKQRLALALAFVNSPDVLLLDEPTASLDPLMRREIHGYIRQMRQEGRSVLLTTHDMEEAEQLCDRIAVLSAGRLVAQGTPRELIAGSGNSVWITLETAIPLDQSALTAMPQIRDAVVEGCSTRLATEDVNGTLTVLLALLNARGIKVTDLQTRRATLEDVIVNLAGARTC